MKSKSLGADEFITFSIEETFVFLSPFKFVTMPSSTLIIGLRSTIQDTSTQTEMKVYRLSSEEQWKKGILIVVDTYRAHTNGRVNGPYKESDYHLTYLSTYFGEFISELKKINYRF